MSRVICARPHSLQINVNTQYLLLGILKLEQCDIIHIFVI